jgi:hypothetical protein
MASGVWRAGPETAEATGPTGEGELAGSDGVTDLASDNDPVLLRAGLASRFVAPMLVGGVGMESSGCSISCFCASSPTRNWSIFRQKKRKVQLFTYFVVHQT